MGRINVIGAGFSGMAAASVLAAHGQEVHVFEKNATPGGRAAVMRDRGFTFDMGPSWYWMPEIFQRFFQSVGAQVSDYYSLVRLDPAYRIFYGSDDYLDISADIEQVLELFETHEKNGAAKLRRFLNDARIKYEVGVNRLVYQPAHSFREFITPEVMRNLFRLSIFRSYDAHMRSYFKNPRLFPVLQFPIVFLGAMPKNSPALYSLMNYADLKLGTWYPMGGFGAVAQAFYRLARKQGVEFHFNQEIHQIQVQNKRVQALATKGQVHAGDVLVSSADYQHTEQSLLKNGYRQYTQKYWDKRVMAPSALMFFIGLDKKLPQLQHHNLLFDEDFNQHTREIFIQPKWPDKPLLYVSVTSKTDSSVAPQGKENLVVLIPVAAGLDDQPQIREHYYQLVIERLERICQCPVGPYVELVHSYAHHDFSRDFNAFRGNAYGLGNTLMQTAFMKPKMKSRRVHNLFYTGQLTTPGPGVPPAIISGQVVAAEVLKSIK